MKHAHLAWCALLMLGLSLPATATEQLVESRDGKLIFQFGNGLLSNAGKQKGSKMVIGAIRFSYFHFVTPSLSFGLGYGILPDYALNNNSVKSYHIGSRLYFLGTGTHYSQKDADYGIERHEKTSFYGGLEYATSTFYLGSNPTLTTYDLTGSYAGFNASAGVEYRIRNRVEVSAQVDMGIISFAESDDRFRLQGYVLNLGIGYLL